MATLQQYNDEQQFVSESVKFIHKIINDAIGARGIAVVGLSGGTSPKPIYQALASNGDGVDWSKVYFFCVDERYIDKASADSIHHLISNSIYAASTPAHPYLSTNFVCPDTSLPLDQCILKYAKDLEAVVARAQGAPDLVTLGMGEDGHIASIFPVTGDFATAAPPMEVVYHTTTTRFAVFDRITTNLYFLSDSRNKLFFMKGASKKVVWDEMLASPESVFRWPAQQIIKSGNTYVNYLA
eukprot:gene12044-14091_t